LDGSMPTIVSCRYSLTHVKQNTNESIVLL
jgi:hypothetical protein